MLVKLAFAMQRLKKISKKFFDTVLTVPVLSPILTEIDLVVLQSKQSKFLLLSSNAKCQGLETAHKDLCQMFQNSNRMFEQILQDFFWYVSFSNKDFKTVEDPRGPWRLSRFELECSGSRYCSKCGMLGGK